MVPVLHDLLSDTAMRPAAIKGLARYDDPKTPDLILKRYATLTEEEKSDAVHTLTSRAAYAKALLDAMEKKQVPIKDVSAFNIRQIQALGNKDLTDTLAKVWGAIRPASQEKAALMTKYKSAMTPEYMKKANLGKGRLLYQKTCAACHRLFGEGGDIGPDLTGSQRHNLDYLLENMIDPSAIVAKDYQVTVLATTGGRIITGIIKGENDKAVTVQTQNELIVLPRGDIESRKQSPLSMMPDGQLDSMTLTQVRDLIAYLASPMQVPLAAEEGVSERSRSTVSGLKIRRHRPGKKMGEREAGKVLSLLLIFRPRFFLLSAIGRVLLQFVRALLLRKHGRESPNVSRKSREVFAAGAGEVSRPMGSVQLRWITDHCKQ